MINFCPAIHVLSAVLKQEGCDVNMFHINNDYGIKYDKDTIIELSAGADLYAITSTSFNYKYANEIAGWLKIHGKLVILGGYHATTQPEDFKDSNFDIFCVGEGEGPMKDLVHALQKGEDWSKIPNLISKYGINPVRGFLRDLNKLPYWDFDITDTAKIIELRGGWLSISFSRGCPYECSFCYNHLLKKIEIGENDKMSDYLRRRTPENTVNELESLVKKYPIKFFNIDDDLLTMNKKWMREFSDLYAEKVYKPFGIKYIMNARADTLNDEICKLLSDSGCFEVRIGFETGNEKLRNNLLDKKTSNEDLISACNNLTKHNIKSVAFLMIGIPGECWDTFDDTVSMTIKLQPKLIRMTFLYPYKYTKIYDVCLERNLFKEEEITDNRDYGSCLKFDKITDLELFYMRFLFPWYVNWEQLHLTEYLDAISKFFGYPFKNAEKRVSEIIEADKELSKNCSNPHYRYYGGNEYYFELYDNNENTI